MLPFRAVIPALAAVLVVVPGASAASPATTPSALTVKSFTAPATVVSGDLLSVRATIGNRGTRAGGTHADVILVAGRKERRLARVVVRTIKPDRRETVTLKAPVPAAGLVGSWKIRVCADAKRALGPGRRGACRTAKRELQVLARSASAGAAAPGTSAPLPTPPVAGGTVLPPGPVTPTPPAPPAPAWKLEMTPNPLVLGAIPAGDDGDASFLSERPFTITNTGTAPSPDFYVSDYGYRANGVFASTFMDVGVSDRCGVLDPGESCNGDLSWGVNGTGTGDLTGELRLLRLATSGPFAYETFQTFPFRADLISRVWFGASDQTVTVNETTREFSLSVYNSGDLSGPVSISPEFPVPSPSGTCAGATLAPDQSCTLIRKGCGLAGSTTVVPYQLFSGTTAASPVANLTIKVPAGTSTSC